MFELIAAFTVPAVTLWFVDHVGNPLIERMVQDHQDKLRDKAKDDSPREPDSVEVPISASALAGQAVWSAVRAANEALKKKTEPVEVPIHQARGDSLRAQLFMFLEGECWYDEVGWQSLWDNAGVRGGDFLSENIDALEMSVKKIGDHPALLSGARRRWIVVNRYAGIDVEVAVEMWNATTTKVAVEKEGK